MRSKSKANRIRVMLCAAGDGSRAPRFSEERRCSYARGRSIQRRSHKFDILCSVHITEVTKQRTSDIDNHRSRIAVLVRHKRKKNPSLSVDLRVKGRIYNALVLSILLYGSEAWCLREDLFNRLRSFHNRCIRSMCRITMAHMMKHRITSKSLFERLGVGSFDSYYNRRLLRWAGHVARMPMDRMPRKLLTGWVEHARPVG